MQVAGIAYDTDRKTKQDRYQGAVRRASFLSDKEKKHWGLLGFVLSTRQLLDAERIIIDEDLRRLGTRHALEKIKPNSENYGR